MKNRHFSYLLVAMLFGAGRSVLADPFAEAALTVFETAGPRQIELASADAPMLTVFSPNGEREAPMPTNWPEIQDRGYLKASSGYRHEKFHFNIAADRDGRRTPNILSELTWDVPAAEIRLDGGWIHRSGFTVKGHLAYALAVSGGRVQDSDYLLDDRQGEFSRSYANPRDSRMLDISLGAGWRFPLGRTASITPMFGLARYDSDYRQRNGKLAWRDDDHDGVNDIAPGDFGNLHSNYSPVWNSVWLGIDGSFDAGERFFLHAGVKRHWFDYRAAADWNLRGDLAHPVSFLDRGYGRGWAAEMGAGWRLHRGHGITLDLSARKFAIENGSAITYFANGGHSEIRLNEAIVDNWSARLGYRYEY